MEAASLPHERSGTRLPLSFILKRISKLASFVLAGFYLSIPSGVALPQTHVELAQGWQLPHPGPALEQPVGLFALRCV